MKISRATTLLLPLFILLGAQCGDLPTGTDPGPEPQPGPPQAPAGLTATPVRAGVIDLAWGDVAGETEFRIESGGGTPGTLWLTTASLPANTVAYRDSGLRSGNTRTYRIQACNAAGCSAFSAVASATVPSPAAPSELTASAVASGRIELAWKDNSSDETGFEVEVRGSFPGAVWTPLPRTVADAKGLAHTGLRAGETNTYRVRACADTGCSGYTAEATATVLPPVAPTDLRAQPAGSGRIDLRWKDNSGDETGFRLEYRSGSSTYWWELATTAANDSTYSHTGLDARDTYAYRVRSCNASGCSEPTPEAQATAAPPAAPSAPRATAVRSGRVNLAWQDNSGDETSFRIEYREAPSTYWWELTSVPANTTSHPHTGLMAGITYTYRVRSCNASGCSDASPEVQATVLGPVAPSGLVATIPGSGRISLVWQDNSADETSFQLRVRSGTSTYWDVLRNLAPDTRAFVHTGLRAGDRYAYRVRACNASGCSEDSNEVSETVTAPAAPGNLVATTPGSGRVSLAWQDNSSEETSVQLQARSATSSYWSVVQNLPADTRAYVHANLQAGDSWVYRVRACNDSGCSANSDEARATVRGPEAPSGLTATGITGAISISWSDNSNDEDYFDLQARPAESAYWSLSSKPAAGVTSHTHNGLTAGAAYVYRIRACNTSGCSPFSNQAGATAAGTPTGPGPGGPGTPGAPGSPVLLAPYHGIRYETREPRLSWTGVAGASAYWLMVAPADVALPTDRDQVNCPGCEVNREVAGTSFQQTARLKPLTRYRWQVKARTAEGWTAWSRVFEFTTATVYCPSGWATEDEGHASVLCRRTFVRRGSVESDYAVVTDVQRGGGVRSLQDRDNDPPPGNPSPRFKKHDIDEWWTLRGSRGFCVLNGVPFRRSPVLDPNVAQLSFPLREDHTLQTVGDDTEDLPARRVPNPFSVLTVNGSTAAIRTYNLPLAERSYAAVNSELAGVRLAAVSQRGDFGASDVPDDQTYAGVADGDGDGNTEVVVFYLSTGATTAEVRDRLRLDYRVPDASRMLRLDGGGSVQLYCGTDVHLRGDGRELAQAFEISTERQ